MDRHQRGRDFFQYHDTNVSEFAPVYYYLFAGITLVVAVFLLLPRVSVG